MDSSSDQRHVAPYEKEWCSSDAAAVERERHAPASLAAGWGRSATPTPLASGATKAERSCVRAEGIVAASEDSGGKEELTSILPGSRRNGRAARGSSGSSLKAHAVDGSPPRGTSDRVCSKTSNLSRQCSKGGLTCRPLGLVAAGHAVLHPTRMLMCDDEDGVPKTILKELDEHELEVYQRMTGSFSGDSALEFVPRFHGVVCDLEEYEGAFLRLDNLLCGFTDPKIMDVKLGCRTFVESEASKSKGRPDLFERAAVLYPEALTAEERAAGVLTKRRFMTLRDVGSTIGSHAFRIDGIVVPQGRKKEKDLGYIRTDEDIRGVFRAFAEHVGECTANEAEGVSRCPAAEPAAEAAEGAQGADDGAADGAQCAQGAEGAVASRSSLTLCVVEGAVSQLTRMRFALESSSFVRQHEFIGSSVLIVADATGMCRTFWIDFAKTEPLADLESSSIDHRRPWTLGNHEDGLLLGLDNMIATWRAVATALKRIEQHGEA